MLSATTGKPSTGIQLKASSGMDQYRRRRRRHHQLKQHIVVVVVVVVVVVIERKRNLTGARKNRVVMVWVLGLQPQ